MTSELVNSAVSKVINAVGVVEPDALIFKREIVEMVVTAENGIRASELLHCLKEIVIVQAAINDIARFARRSVNAFYIRRVFISVFCIFDPCFSVFAERNVDEYR